MNIVTHILSFKYVVRCNLLLSNPACEQHVACVHVFLLCLEKDNQLAFVLILDLQGYKSILRHFSFSPLPAHENEPSESKNVTEVENTQ